MVFLAHIAVDVCVNKCPHSLVYPSCVCIYWISKVHVYTTQNLVMMMHWELCVYTVFLYVNRYCLYSCMQNDIYVSETRIHNLTYYLAYQIDFIWNTCGRIIYILYNMPACLMLSIIMTCDCECVFFRSSIVVSDTQVVVFCPYAWQDSPVYMEC